MAGTSSAFFAKKRPQNVKMLQRVMVKLKEDQNDTSQENVGTYLDKAAMYTGLQTKVLEDLQNNETYQIEFKEIDRGVIYEELTSFYLNKKMIPTTRQLFEALYKKIPPYIDIRTFRKTLVKMGFVWKRVNDFNVVVIEKPTIIFERYTYLKNIMNYRDEGRPIYFIDENAIELINDYFSLEESMKFSNNFPSLFMQKVIYAVSKEGIHTVKYIDKFDEQTFTDWLTKDFLPTLDQPSVIVFNGTKHHCEYLLEPPNKESVKNHIYKWLSHHTVPFDEEMSKYELLHLTENYTDLDENMYIIDRILKESGHVALRTPDCIKKLTPASLVCNLIKENKDHFFTQEDWSEESFREALDSIPVETLVRYDKYIAEHEKDIFMKDTEIDKVFDELLTKANEIPLTGDQDSDIPSCSDSD